MTIFSYIILNEIFFGGTNDTSKDKNKSYKFSGTFITSSSMKAKSFENHFSLYEEVLFGSIFFC